MAFTALEKVREFFSGNFVVSVLWLLLFLFGFVIVKLRNLLQIQIMGAVPDKRINHKNYNFLNHIQFESDMKQFTPPLSVL